MKTRQAFYLHTTKLTRIARRLCREILRPWHAARHPYMPINSAAIKAECECRPPAPGSVLGGGAHQCAGRLAGMGVLTPGSLLCAGPPQARPGCPKPPRAHWC